MFRYNHLSEPCPGLDLASRGKQLNVQGVGQVRSSEAAHESSHSGSQRSSGLPVSLPVWSLQMRAACRTWSTVHRPVSCSAVTQGQFSQSLEQANKQQVSDDAKHHANPRWKELLARPALGTFSAHSGDELRDRRRSRVPCKGEAAGRGSGEPRADPEQAPAQPSPAEQLVN